MKTTAYSLTAALALSTAWASSPLLAAELVPYRGTVAGEVEGNALSGELTSSVAHQGSHVGKGTQITTSIDLGAVASLLQGAPLPIGGSATTVAANGDQLNLNFTLIPTALNPDGTISYVGSYSIEGGTGRFDYAAAGVTGDLGSGALNGVAALVPTGLASVSITFSHTFDGTLARPVGR